MLFKSKCRSVQFGDIDSLLSIVSISFLLVTVYEIKSNNLL